MADVGCLVTVLLTIAILLPAASPALAEDAPAAASPVAGALLDVAAMALTPDDLAAAGFAGYLIADGRTQSLEDRVAEQAAGGTSPARIRQSLASLGWVRGYRSRLAHPVAPNGVTFDALVSSGIVQFADPAGATAGWEAISQSDIGTSGGTPLPAARTIADRSRLVDAGSVTFDHGTLHPTLRLVLQRGVLVGDLIVFGATGRPPAAADVEALGARQLRRMQRVLTGGGPGLSLKVLRRRGSGLTNPDRDNYLKIDGALYNGLGDTDQDIAIAADIYKQATDDYRYEAALTDSTYQYTSVARFASAALATGWVNDACTRTDKNRPTGSTLERVPDAPSFGDESVSLRVTTAIQGSEAVGYAVFVGTGDEAFSLALFSLRSLDLGGVIATAENQVASFKVGDCRESVPLPAWLSA